jgi:hypothetical protein
MSPVKRASTVDGLRRGVGQPPEIRRPSDELPAPPSVRTKPVRVTLNFPPDLFRDLDRWAREAADALDVPRVGVQDAVRAMVRVITSGEARNAEILVLAEVRRARQ